MDTYCTAKLQFFRDFPLKVAYCTSVCIIIELLQYLMRWCEGEYGKNTEGLAIARAGSQLLVNLGSPETV